MRLGKVIAVCFVVMFAMTVARQASAAVFVHSTQTVELPPLDPLPTEIPILTTLPDEAYVMLGKVSAFSTGIGSNKRLNLPGEPKKKIVRQLKEHAIGMGGNAIYGVQHGKHLGASEGGEYFSALVLRVGPSAEHAVGDYSFAVCVLPVVDLIHKGEKAGKHDRLLRVAVRWDLEFRGYYTVTPENIAPIADTSNISAAEVSQAEAACGEQINRILIIEKIPSDEEDLAVRVSFLDEGELRRSGLGSEGKEDLYIWWMTAIASKSTRISNSMKESLAGIKEIRTGGRVPFEDSRVRAE